MSPRDGALRLRLLLSWQERLALQSKRRPQEERTAARELKALRQEARHAIEATGERLQHALAGQGADGDEVMRLRHDIAQFNLLLKAGTSQELGGFADLPLEQYPLELGLQVSRKRYGLERDDFITIVVSIILMVSICGGIAWFHLWRAEVAFNISRPGPRHVAIEFQNHSSFTTYLVGPWPEVKMAYDHNDFGLTLHCRAAGTENFQDCTNLRDVWTYQRRTLSPAKPIQVESGMSVVVVLDLTRLESAYGAPIAEVRVDCGTTWRRARYTFTETIRSE